MVLSSHNDVTSKPILKNCTHFQHVGSYIFHIILYLTNVNRDITPCEVLCSLFAFHKTQLSP